MTNVTHLTQPDQPDLLVGPFQVSHVVLEGRAIPLLTGRKTATGTVLIVDGRFEIEFPNELAYQAAWLLAQAIAVAQGYSHLGAKTKERPFAPMIKQISL